MEIYDNCFPFWFNSRLFQCFTSNRASQASLKILWALVSLFTMLGVKGHSSIDLKKTEDRSDTRRQAEPDRPTRLGTGKHPQSPKIKKWTYVESNNEKQTE